MNKAHEDLSTMVLIVGGGPIGLLSALLLSAQGISSTIVERKLERMTAPKAHAVNPRTLEICAQLGLPIEDIYAAAAPREQGGWVQFMSRLDGHAFGALPYERQDDAVTSLTPFPLANIAQPRFEEILERAVETKADIRLMRGLTCTGFSQTDERVHAQIETVDAQQQFSIAAHFLLAADGAGSRVRAMLGIDMEGPEAIQHFMMIHFQADLTKLVAQRPGILYFLLDPNVAGTLIAYDQNNNWVLMHSCSPEQHKLEHFDEKTCQKLVENAVGEPVPGCRIENVSPWVMSSQVAQSYGSGRVFLVGDAAHRFPPSGGLGLNTGVGDAQNICWKIAAVHKGWAGSALLQSYESERQPVAKINSDQSLTNAAKIFDLIALTLGDDPARQEEHFSAFCQGASENRELKHVIDAQKPHFDSLRLQMGYRYGSEAMSQEDRDVGDYRLEHAEGFRLPHQWVFTAGERRSILDLLPANQFTLILPTDSEAWRLAALQCSIPVTCLVNGIDFEIEQTSEGLPQTPLLLRPDGHIACVLTQAETPSLKYLERLLDAQLRRNDTLNNEVI